MGCQCGLCFCGTRVLSSQNVLSVPPRKDMIPGEDLDRFCHACFRALRPGGRLVGFNDNVRNPPRPGVSLAKYGLERTCAYPPREGDVIQYRITNHDGQVFEFENYYLAPATYEAAAHDAGFDDFRWVDAMLEPTERDDPFWNDFLTYAPLIAFSASKR